MSLVTSTKVTRGIQKNMIGLNRMDDVEQYNIRSVDYQSR